MVLRRTLNFMAIGLSIGIAGALALTHLLWGLLFEVRPTDAVAYFGASLVLALFALVASLIPAWRATRLDPLVVLKVE
jgi:putative ABC transport system permease protein